MATSIDPNSGGIAFGEQTPTMSETPVSWQNFSDGAGGIPSVTGDADWGDISLNDDEEGRTPVYDFGNSFARTITLTKARYGAESGTGVLQIRGALSEFTQDASTPEWQDYDAAVEVSWRYFQIRAINSITEARFDVSRFGLGRFG